MRINHEELISMSALIVDDELHKETATGRRLQALIKELKNRDIQVVESDSDEDARAVILSSPQLQTILLDWSLDENKSHTKTGELIKLIRERNTHIPIFLMAERSDAASIPADLLSHIDEFIWILEDTTFFIAGRVQAAILRYRQEMLPPMTKALLQFAQVYEYSWHTPGHTGGIAFLKSPIGRVYYEYFGENLLRSDLSISVGELGSLLDHSGPIGESEKYAARVFGANRSYTVTNGSSTSNRVIFMACVTQGDIALVDRNCHKSLEQALTLTGAIPTYLKPSRNYLGIIGPIYPEQLKPDVIQTAVKKNNLAANTNHKPSHSVITNSTYDGICYNAARIVELLGQSVDRIHFDEAWYGYARFNPIYENRYGMYGNPEDYPKDAPTIFTTTSTHKLLAALSQASFIHVRDGRNPVEHGRFNESFMMHASTSPQYAIICSNEISAAMMEGVSGKTLTTESIQEAVSFRQTLRRIARKYAENEDWFFTTWNSDFVKDASTGKMISFEDAPEDLLVTNPDAWVLHPGDEWHGFKNLEDDYCMLDPIKVSVVTPGINIDGSFQKMGIPATLLTAYLDRRGIVVEKTTDFTILFLFSMGITKGKWGTLINALLNFKEDYERNAPLSEVIPALVESYPERYLSVGLRDLAMQMFSQMKESKQLQFQEEAFSVLPESLMTPNSAYQRLVHNEVEKITIDKMANRIVATGIVPYPPGIPMLMPGENAGTEDGAYLGYLSALQSWDLKFPGFEHDIHGVEVEDGIYHVYCLKEQSK